MSYTNDIIWSLKSYSLNARTCINDGRDKLYLSRYQTRLIVTPSTLFLRCRFFFMCPFQRDAVHLFLVNGPWVDGVWCRHGCTCFYDITQTTKDLIYESYYKRKEQLNCTSLMWFWYKQFLAMVSDDRQLSFLCPVDEVGRELSMWYGRHSRCGWSRS